MKISIPEPCHEDWNAMTPVDFQHRHCAACDRTLTDFSAMTDAEIGNHLRRHAGKICGRISTSQLNRKLAINGPRQFGGTRAVAAAAGLLLAVPVVGQGGHPPQTELSPKVNHPSIGNPVEGDSKAGVLPGNITITGVVTDETGEPLIGSSVLIMGTTNGTVTDINGRFSLEVSIANPVKLQISYTGFVTREVEVDASTMKGAASTTLVLEVAPLPMDEMIMGIVITRHRSLAHRIIVAPVSRYVIGPVKRAVRDIGDWRRGRFDRRAARQLRRAERQATQIDRLQEQSMTPATQASVATLHKEVAPATLGFKASPNPFNDHLRVSFSLAERGAYRLELYDVSGKQLGYWENEGEEGPQQRVLDRQLSGLPAGMYFLELTTKTTASVLTLVR